MSGCTGWEVDEAPFARAYILLSTLFQMAPTTGYWTVGMVVVAYIHYDRVNPTSQDKGMEQLLHALQLDPNREDLSG